MKIAVIGLWHLGCVTATCTADVGHQVIAYDPSLETVDQLQKGHLPIFEPGLEDLFQKVQSAGRLSFSSERNSIADSDIVWIAFDTPVDDQDIADTNFVLSEVCALFPYLKAGALVLISSQVPAGTTRKLKEQCSLQYPDKKITFAYTPENLRLGKAIEVFMQPDRVIVGLETEANKEKILTLFRPITQNIVWMSIESAEMTKHALNAFLATSVAFINELSTLCERVGADAYEVERGLKSEVRIGPKAYLRPGNAIAGGTLARDVNYLIQMGQQKNIETPFFSALLESNEAHKKWACRRVVDVLKNLEDKTITLLGLTYKPGTNTLRRSTAIETARWLSQQGATILAYDPSIQTLPADLASFITLKSSPSSALKAADAVLVSTEWPEFIQLTADEILQLCRKPLVLDPGSFLAKNLGKHPDIHYLSVGTPL